MPTPATQVDHHADDVTHHDDENAGAVEGEADTAAARIDSAEWYLTLHDGSTITVTDAVLVGRNPSARAPWQHADVVSLEDSTQSVSKTHAAIEVDARGMWVHDLDSTNGVWVVVGDNATEVATGRRVAVPPGAVIELGEYELTVNIR